LRQALGDQPVLILLDELVLYMARAFALREDHPRSKVNSQWPTFFQTLFSIAAQRPHTAVILTLPSEQDANRKLTGELKQFIPTVLETVDELEQTAARQARNLTPTQSYERAAVLGRRLFKQINASHATQVAEAYAAYYAEQRDAGVQLDSRAFEPNYIDQIRVGYPFHPELIRLFAERLADIPEFQATRGALRLVARTMRAVWDRKQQLKGTLLWQPHHVDLTRSDLRDEILSRLGRMAFERGLEADVMRSEGGTHANQVEEGWPWRAATKAALVTFLHSLPDGSKGMTPSEVALAIGRPGCDLAYVARGLEETE
jgi:predicted AAA+ superfamily ATPase